MIAGVPTFSCNCTPGWTGPTCSEDIDFCASQPCLNGGTCIDTGNGYTCNCTGNYTGPAGKYCTNSVDECQQTSSCQNEGNCSNLGESYNCSCAPFYTGANCEILMSCISTPCENGTMGEYPTPPHEVQQLLRMNIVTTVILIVLLAVLCGVPLVVHIVLNVVACCYYKNNK